MSQTQKTQKIIDKYMVIKDYNDLAQVCQVWGPMFVKPLICLWAKLLLNYRVMLHESLQRIHTRPGKNADYDAGKYTHVPL